MAHRKHVYKKHPDSYRTTEQYHFKKAKQTPLHLSDMSLNKTLTVTQAAVLTLAILYMIQNNRFGARAQHIPQSHSTCLANMTLAASIIPVENPPTPSYEFHGIPAINVSQLLHNCERKSEGISLGKICLYKNKKYILKFADDSQHYLASLYNQKLLKEHVNVMVPTMSYFYECSDQNRFSSTLFGKTKNQVYLASEFLKDFVKIASIYQEADYALFGSENWFSFYYHSWTSMDKIYEKISDLLREKVDEKEIAKILVASTLISDLANNEGNWGISGNRITIVDVDSHGATIQDLSSAANSLRELPINFSVNTITLARDIYNNMLKKPAPRVNIQVDIPAANYQALITSYRDACVLALEKIQANTNIDKAKPSRVINSHLIASFLATHKNKAAFSFY